MKKEQNLQKDPKALHIGSVVWRFLLAFIWVVLSCNLGLLIGKAIIHYNLEDSLMWFLRLFKWV
jgi:hypothetical protein